MKKITNKLTLKKEVVAKLSNPEAARLAGGSVALGVGADPATATCNCVQSARRIFNGYSYDIIDCM